MSLDISLFILVDTGGKEPNHLTLASSNMTHNVSTMWRLVGVYDALYESHGKLAGDYVDALNAGIDSMKEKIDECRVLNPSNGWGDADSALDWLIAWRDECDMHPKATIDVSR